MAVLLLAARATFAGTPFSIQASSSTCALVAYGHTPWMCGMRAVVGPWPGPGPGRHRPEGAEQASLAPTCCGSIAALPMHGQLHAHAC